jgi:hypothetical protein
MYERFRSLEVTQDARKYSEAFKILNLIAAKSGRSCFKNEDVFISRNKDRNFLSQILVAGNFLRERFQSNFILYFFHC